MFHQYPLLCHRVPHVFATI